jgi:hypothetical protein
MGIRNGCLQISRVRSRDELGSRRSSVQPHDKYEVHEQAPCKAPSHSRSRSECFYSKTAMNDARRRRASFDSRLTNRRRSVRWIDDDCPTSSSPVSSVHEYNPKDSLLLVPVQMQCPDTPHNSARCDQDDPVTTRLTDLMSTDHFTTDCISQSCSASAWPEIRVHADEHADEHRSDEAQLNQWSHSQSAKATTSANWKKCLPTVPRARSVDDTMSDRMPVIPVAHSLCGHLHQMQDIQPHPFGADIADEECESGRTRMCGPQATPFIMIPRKSVALL